MGKTLSEIEWVSIDSLLIDPANDRVHSERNLSAIRASLRRFGQQKPIVVDGENIVRAGNGTWLAAKAEGWTEIAVVRTALTGAEAMAFALVDNRTAELAEWDEKILSQQTGALAAEGAGIDEAWWSNDELMDLQAAVSDLQTEEGPSDASLLKKLKVTLEEPATVVQSGQVFRLDNRHILVVADVVKDHQVWGGYLTICDLFCPYPGVFTPLTKAAASNRLLMVQPDAFLAGHLVDRYKAINAGAVIELLASGQVEA